MSIWGYRELVHCVRHGEYCVLCEARGEYCALCEARGEYGFTVRDAVCVRCSGSGCRDLTHCEEKCEDGE